LAALIREATILRLEEAVVPDDFAEVMGYEPVNEDGRLVRRDGGCSIPGGGGAFEAACRAHDFGYDLLRYGERTGHRLGPDLRLEIDRRFHQDMLEACTATGCRLRAHVFSLGVALNSIRQGYSTPLEEPPTPWILAGLATVGLALYPGTTISRLPPARVDLDSPALSISGPHLPG